jgi:hypothetical protein
MLLENKMIFIKIFVLIYNKSSAIKKKSTWSCSKIIGALKIINKLKNELLVEIYKYKIEFYLK